ncbi:hypothetical protein R6Q59_027783 [Mikania micrantha]
MVGAHKNGDTTVGNSCWATPHQHPVNTRAVRSDSGQPLTFFKNSKRPMDSLKMKLFAAVVVMLMAAAAVSNVAAQEAPAAAPGPASGASVFIPTVVASLMAICVGFLF